MVLAGLSSKVTAAAASAPDVCRFLSVADAFPEELFPSLAGDGDAAAPPPTRKEAKKRKEKRSGRRPRDRKTRGPVASGAKYSKCGERSTARLFKSTEQRRGETTRRVNISNLEQQTAARQPGFSVLSFFFSRVSRVIFSGRVQIHRQLLTVVGDV